MGWTQQSPLVCYHTMPASRTTASSSRPSPATAPVPRSLGYAAYLDHNEDEVFTRLDQTLMDRREVVPFNLPEYPGHDEVSVHQT